MYTSMYIFENNKNIFKNKWMLISGDTIYGKSS